MQRPKRSSNSRRWQRNTAGSTAVICGAKATPRCRRSRRRCASAAKRIFRLRSSDLKMKSLVAQAMQQGAFGISTALIYPPGHYAKTEEIIELAKVAAQYGGIYGSHMRSEGNTEVQAIQEALRIGREANIPVEIFRSEDEVSGSAGDATRRVRNLHCADLSAWPLCKDRRDHRTREGGSAIRRDLRQSYAERRQHRGAGDPGGAAHRPRSEYSG